MKQKEDNRTIDIEDIFVWPCGTWCYRYQAWEMDYKSDDYEVLHFDTPEYVQFVAKTLNL